MIPFYRFLEVTLYSLLNFLPFLLLAMYPFRRHLRFSARITGISIGLLCLIWIGYGFMIAFSSVDPNLLAAASTVIYTAFYFIVVKNHFGRKLFMLLVLSNVGHLVTILAKCLEGLLFPDLALEPYRWSLCICMGIIHLIITIPLAFYIHKYYTASIPIHATAWSYLWVIPATFYLIWYYHVYFTTRNSLQAALDLDNALFLLFINIGAFVVYHIAIVLLQTQEKAYRLTQENHLLSMHKLQYDNLQQRINEARQAKHDVRHHAHLIREYLHSGKLEELDAYLDSYCASLPDTQSLVYCSHYATNALLGYFAQQAQECGVEMDIFVQLPESIRLPETTLAVVLGNLLENAIEACKEIPDGEKKITVRGKCDMGSVFFEITNTFIGKLHRSRSGRILSTKATNRGLGLESVAQLAQSHGGMLELDAENGIFRASVLLPEQPPQV